MKNINFDLKEIKDTEYENEQFTNCSFLETSFKTCRFLECKFIKCRISAIKLLDSELIEAQFIDSKVEGVDFTLLRTVRNIEFKNCILNYSNFNMLKLPKLKLINCEAKEVTFSEADLEESDFSGTDFENSVFFKTNLKKTNFIGAYNYWVDVLNNKLTGASFSLPQAVDLLTPLKIKVV